MKTYTKTLVAVLALSAAALTINAQDDPRPRPPGGGDPGRPGGPGPGGAMRNPLLAVLDANSDGELDATEISNATAALRRLDRNNDGRVTRDELRPTPPGREGREGRPGRPEGERPRRRDGDGPTKE